MRQWGYQAVHLERDVANQFLARGKVNGSRAVFEVDTGAGTTCIDATKATKLKPLSRDKEGSGLFGFTVKDVKVVAIDSMELGGITISNQLGRVIDLHRDRQSRIGSRIPETDMFNKKDVLLGLDFLRDTHAVLDCAASGAPALYLRGQKPSERLSEIMEQSFKMGGFVSVPLEFMEGKFLVKGIVNGKETHFFLDTGSGMTLLDLKLAAKFQISINSQVGEAIDVGAKRTDLMYGIVSAMTFGEFEQRNFRVGLADLGLESGKSDEENNAVLGLLGTDLLGQARAVIDCGTGKLYLKPKQAK